ncbi:MAG TPA: YdcF family protein [Vicinamibacteria bacterium]|nr:YdcF family protein [Vicinamibacteria bacterium]
MLRPPSRAAAAAGALSLASFFVLAYTPVAGAISRRLATTSSTEPADAIVVLGAGASSDGVLSHHSLRRLVGGLLLYHRGLAPRLIVMGPAGAGEPLEAELRAGLARELGVPKGALVVEGHGLTTRHEAALAARRLRRWGGRRVLLVTGALHMQRAARLFEGEGLEVVPAPVPEMSYATGRPDARLELARLAAMELLARLYYRGAGFH